MEKFITGYCQLQNGKLILNSKNLFEADIPVDEFLNKIVAEFEVKHPRFGKLDRLSKLGYTCAEILLQSLGNFKKYQPYEVNLVFANSSSSLDTDFRFQKTIETIASPALFVYTLPNIMLAEICIKNGFKGENLFLVSDFPEGNLFYEPINQMFAQQSTKACLAGWVEIFGEIYTCTLFAIESTDNKSDHQIEFNITNINKLFEKF